MLLIEEFQKIFNFWSDSRKWLIENKTIFYSCFLLLGTISSTFYKQLLRAAFTSSFYKQLLQKHWWLDCLFILLGYVRVKALSKCTNFSNECHFSSYVLALSKNLYEKFVRKTLMKLTPVLTNKVYHQFRQGCCDLSQFSNLKPKPKNVPT